MLLDGEEESDGGEEPLTEEEAVELVRTEFDAEEFVADPDQGEAEEAAG